MYLAHRSEDGREQSILEHAKNVSELCAEFAAPFGAEELAKQIGLAHDIGKYSEKFQRRIGGENVQVDHSTAGAQEIVKYSGWPAAYCVAGHHGGLPDGGGKTSASDGPTLSGRLKREVEPHGDFAGEIALAPVGVRPPKMLGRGGFTMAFWIRMLFSCLVDADYLDTEAFMQKRPPHRGSELTTEQLREKLDTYVARWDDPKSELNRARYNILHACIETGGEAGARAVHFDRTHRRRQDRLIAGVCSASRSGAREKEDNIRHPVHKHHRADRGQISRNSG